MIQNSQEHLWSSVTAIKPVYNASKWKSQRVLGRMLREKLTCQELMNTRAAHETKSNEFQIQASFYSANKLKHKCFLCLVLCSCKSLPVLVSVKFSSWQELQWKRSSCNTGRLSLQLSISVSVSASWSHSVSCSAHHNGWKPLQLWLKSASLPPRVLGISIHHYKF